MQETNRDYFARRAREERQAAERAASDSARLAHAGLAERYAKLAEALEAAGDDGESGVNWAVVSRVSLDAERRPAAPFVKADV